MSARRIKRLRDNARVNQNNWCWWCMCEMSNPRAAGARDLNSCTAEHLVTINEGGPKNSSWNIKAACYRCNHIRSTMTEEEFFSWLRQHLKKVEARWREQNGHDTG